jgi:uncharacterized protein YcbX
MDSGRIKALYRYPVKSMAGERLDTLTIGPRGVPGDRAWAVRDEELGGIRGGKRFAELMQCAARYLEEPPVEGSAPALVTMPDGREVSIRDPAMPELLSALVGSPLTVWPLLPADRLDHYRRGAPVLPDALDEFRRVFGRTEDEPLPDVSTFPEFLREFESPPGTYFDAFPLLVMTTESLAHLQRLVAHQRFDVARFRPNLLIETGADVPFPEREWPGRTLKIGSVELEVVMDCPRCVMTTHGFSELPNDPGIMRSLVSLADGDLGVYANVSIPGQVRVDDPVTLA